MNERKPLPGDRVRVTFEGRYVRKSDGDHHVVTADHDWSHETPNGAVLEVLEPADDPRKELDGSVRKDPEFEKPDRVVVAVHPVRVDGPRWRSVSGDYYRRDEEVIGWVRLAPVAGTPAAEAQSTVDAATLFPPPAGTAPRVFRSDGPEPPPDVKVVEQIDGPGLNDSTPQFLVRYGDHWRWATAPDADEQTHFAGGPWSGVKPEAARRFREVQP